ncbi:Chemotaxis protein CheA [Rubripirellula lacrimiformis]|uniref:histidine kinase n=1 Tax=Rubripirellula lacrimiformis TaxID=1930273 RepID=A0A517NIM3_9BACT|nr:chemotaxis protein CheA [Rubripirellula lacrimiformis]QDT06938.1 Chemotaxis protein CheA [Rubripirellula lacrimiformis]
MTIDDTEILNEFVIESQEHLGDIETDFLTLELQIDGVDVALVNKIFRAIHSIKGAAGFMGLHVLEKLAHREEEVLNRMRNLEIAPTSPVINTLLRSTDAIKHLLDNIETSNDEDVSVHIKALSQLLDTSAEAAVSDVVEVSAERLDGIEEAMQSIEEPQPTGAEAPAAEVRDETETPLATTVETKPTPNAKTPSAAKPQATEPAHQDKVTTESSIRVDVCLLDMLMNQVGELVLARNQMLQFANRFEDGQYNKTSQRLNLITTELQEGVMKTRMQPIGNVWSKFPRLVRDLAQICDKEVRIEMEGKSTELDKTIIEAIKDPLTHLVRNTVDHGIENPDVRESNGKNREGCLTLRAFHEGGQVNIEISDDGAGLNLNRIKQKAVEKGVITQKQAEEMQDHELCNLIFAPGFSTAETVSNVSGRGVGMDVVKTNIEKIGGTLDLDSRPGIGTTVRIKIPLTLAIIPALLVSCAGNRFAIPQVNLMELVRLEGEQSRTKIEWIQNAPVYRLRGRLLPLVDLRQVLKREVEKNDESNAINIVILRADDQQFGLIVDHISDTEEIVVKPLSQQLKDLPIYSGATIMGDGNVALILDVLGIAQRSNVLQANLDKAMKESSVTSEAPGAALQTLLILGLGSTTRVAMPMSQVARLEQIAKNSIEVANNRPVVQYRGKILPLIHLPETLGTQPRSGEASTGDEEEFIHVVVYTEDTRSFGLVVDRILDIVETKVEISESSRSCGLLGSAIIQSKVIDLLDLPVIIQSFDAPNA